MKLLDEIIQGATNSNRPVADVLRKCLILAFELKNEKLKTWVEGELNGFQRGEDDELLPEYRKLYLNSKGNFSGPAGAWLPQRSLPLSILKPEHRKYLSPAVLHEPIAAYEFGQKGKEGGEARLNWPADLIVHYQDKFIEGYALWPAPGSVDTRLS